MASSWPRCCSAPLGLFAATIDRWNWKRIGKWVLIAPVVLVAVLGAGLYTYKLYDEHLKVEDTFDGLTLASTRANVRFLKSALTKGHSGIASNMALAARGEAGGPIPRC